MPVHPNGIWALQPHAAEHRACDPLWSYQFNSYYDAVGERHPRPQRGLLSRPTIGAVLAWRQRVDAGLEALLLGLDQPREPALMEAAYDDAAGVSAAFARNLLQRLNRELQGDADPTQFRYQAHWQATQERIEMALVSTQDQTVLLGGESWFFRQGDAWITEHSVKYSPDAAAALAALAGWRIQRRWTDPNQQIALHLLMPAN